jgi:hypothetical protein
MPGLWRISIGPEQPTIPGWPADIGFQRPAAATAEARASKRDAYFSYVKATAARTTLKTIS